MGMISTKLRNSARGEECTFQIPGVCNHNPETTVLAHLPSEWKGMGTKSPDWCAAFACSSCHESFDNRWAISEVDMPFYAHRALQRTWRRWIERGLIVLPVDPETAKKRPKRKAKMPSRPIPSRPFPKRNADA